MGNLDISLFWEEKALMIIRFIQFYGYLLMAFYEEFPFDYRDQWARFFFFMTGSFQLMLGQSFYYQLIQSKWQTIGNLIGYHSFMVLIIGLFFLFMFKKTLHFRLLMLKK
jgi:hypothetical protein